MKAKSWKSFVDQKPKKKKAATKGEKNLEQEFHANPLEEAIEQNSTLKKLMTERQELEKKMGALTGQTDFGNFGDQFKGKLGEIPSFKEKKKEINAWDQSRKKALESLKNKLGNDRQAPTGLTDLAERSNLKSLGAEVPGGRFAEKLTEKKDEFGSKKKVKDAFEKKLKDKVPSGLKRKKETFDKVSKKVNSIKKKKDDWLEKKEKLESKYKNAKKEVSRFNDSIDNLQKDLDRFSAEGGGSSSDAPDLRGEISKIKDRFATDSKVGQKMKKMTDSFNKKRGGEKLDQKWAKVKNKQKELNRAKSKYEARREKLLNVNKNTLEELDEKRRALKEQLSAKKKAERREEERKAKRKEEQKAERDAERKEEEKRENRREKRKRQKKERF